jgi:hypothetical protein
MRKRKFDLIGYQPIIKKDLVLLPDDFIFVRGVEGYRHYSGDFLLWDATRPNASPGDALQDIEVSERLYGRLVWYAKTDIEEFNKSLVQKWAWRFAGLPWVRVILRKTKHERKCALCQEKIISGSIAYRPLRENKSYPRYVRVCNKCANRLGSFGIEN